MIVATSAGLAIAVNLVGCDGCKSKDAASNAGSEATPLVAAEPATPEGAPVEAAPTKDDEALEPEVVTDGYEVKSHVDLPYPKGEPQKFSVEIRGRGEWHVNVEYPFALTLRSDAGIELPVKELTQADAAEFTADVARFDIPFTMKDAGDGCVYVEADFAVCTKENCLPATETIRVPLASK